MSDPIRPPHFLANNLGLDFINSAFGVGEHRHDGFSDDASVLAWLKAADALPAEVISAPSGLAKLAKSLRDSAARCVEAARLGQPTDPGVINQILKEGLPVPQLCWNAPEARFTLTENRRDDSAASLLQPVAASLILLLTHEDLQHVRQCEAHDCTLTFLDTTKSKRRRWCSMALCGNRMKVAAFRSRKQVDGH